MRDEVEATRSAERARTVSPVRAKARREGKGGGGRGASACIPPSPPPHHHHPHAHTHACARTRTRAPPSLSAWVATAWQNDLPSRIHAGHVQPDASALASNMKPAASCPCACGTPLGIPPSSDLPLQVHGTAGRGGTGTARPQGRAHTPDVIIMMQRGPGRLYMTLLPGGRVDCPPGVHQRPRRPGITAVVGMAAWQQSMLCCSSCWACGHTPDRAST